ncbi:MAG: lipid-A-disaccharide synthase [Bacteroidales bacterium]|jgi:lipid-A-disaccharide synthase|nr:lipid-A-disaccharide synthase [Bacteroidales bacterium]
MRYFIIAGEQSGDLHGSNLIRGIKTSDPDAVIDCWGGDLMEEAGGRLLMHYRYTAFMGFLSVIKNLGKIAANIKKCRRDILDSSPDVVILIDYPGFNLRIAEFASGRGIRVFYYISPKLWAWKENRIKKVKKYVNRMFIIFPFEVPFYAKHGISVEYLGNPLVDELEKKLSSIAPLNETMASMDLDERPVIALLCGSRKHEVEKILPVMISVTDHFPGYQFVIAAVKNLPEALYRSLIANKPVRIVTDRTYELLSISSAALVTSGTATLETALMEIPQVVCYKADWISMFIAWLVIKVRFISLVNLVLQREAVRELVQHNLTTANLVKELKKILPGSEARETLMNSYRELKEILGPAGASSRVAAEMARELREKSNDGL